MSNPGRTTMTTPTNEPTTKELIELRGLLQDIGSNNYAMNSDISQSLYEAMNTKNARSWARMIEIETAITARIATLEAAVQEREQKITRLREALEDVRQWMRNESNKGKLINGVLFSTVCSALNFLLAQTAPTKDGES